MCAKRAPLAGGVARDMGSPRSAVRGTRLDAPAAPNPQPADARPTGLWNWTPTTGTPCPARLRGERMVESGDRRRAIPDIPLVGGAYGYSCSHETDVRNCVHGENCHE